MRRLIPFACALLVFGCRPSQQAPTSKPLEGRLLAVREAKILRWKPATQFLVHEDGAIASEEGVIARLSGSGEVLDDHGHVAARIDERGRVTLVGRTHPPIVIDTNGTLHVGPTTHAIDEEGRVEGLSVDTHVFASDPAGMRAAMFVTVVLFWYPKL